MTEEILTGVHMRPDHEKKGGATYLVGCAVLAALLFGAALAGGIFVAAVIFAIRG